MSVRIVEAPENWFTSPVAIVRSDDGADALVRPGELLVEAAAEPHLASHLESAGGRRYEQSQSSWRNRVGMPDSGDLNARLEAAGTEMRLWEGVSEYSTFVSDERRPGLRYHHVLCGENFYHGGPGGTPVAVGGPPAALLAVEPATDGLNDIAVLDNGLPEGWESLPGQLGPVLTRRGIEVIPGDPVDADGDGIADRQAGHGLFISGLITRVSALLDILLRRVLNSSGEGDEAIIAATLSELVATDVKVVNLSLGAYTVDNEVPALLAAAVQQLVAAGKIVVAAAGNAGDSPELVTRPFWPASLPGVVAVGAFDHTQNPPKPWFKSNVADVYAPGVDVQSTFIKWPLADGSEFDGWARWSGTSFAAPLVAASICDRLMRNPTTPAAQVLQEWLQNQPQEPTWPTLRGGPALRHDVANDLIRW
ncbi:S8/S53 family peptidase [Pseudonocardia sp. GCM10023141]|uniref:S8/S53 family peptidase n=1 Tax=Pseudonocardia sp. GCM10023141 TaxID=3252653 RepID=UPI0036192C6D